MGVTAKIGEGDEYEIRSNEFVVADETVVKWRRDALERAGYGEAAAEALAVRADVDLHRAVELIERCPAELALDILL